MAIVDPLELPDITDPLDQPSAVVDPFDSAATTDALPEGKRAAPLRLFAEVTSGAIETTGGALEEVGKQARESEVEFAEKLPRLIVDGRDLSLFRRDAPERGIERVGTAVKTFSDLPEDLQLDDGMVRDIARAVGSSGAAILAGIATRGYTVPAAIGSFMGANEFRTDAEMSGADEEAQAAAADIGLAVGLSEVAPVERLFKVLNRTGGSTVWRELAGMAQVAGAEWIQETFQAWMGNLTARDFVGYDPDRELTEDLFHSGEVGAGAGAVVYTLMRMLGVRPRTTPEGLPNLDEKGPTQEEADQTVLNDRLQTLQRKIAETEEALQVEGAEPITKEEEEVATTGTDITDKDVLSITDTQFQDPVHRAGMESAVRGLPVNNLGSAVAEEVRTVEQEMEANPLGTVSIVGFQNTTPEVRAHSLALQDTVRAWQEEFMPGEHIVIMDATADLAMRGRFNDLVPGKRLGALIQGRMAGMAVQFGPNLHGIYVKPTFPRNQQFAVAGHEFGHTLSYTTFQRMPEYVQRAVKRGYLKWLKTQQRGISSLLDFPTPGKVTRSRAGPVRMPGEASSKDFYITHSDYYLSMDEYFADQMTARLQRKPVDAGTNKFFSETLRTLKRFFRKYGEVYTGDKSFDLFVESLSLRNQYKQEIQKINEAMEKATAPDPYATAEWAKKSAELAGDGGGAVTIEEPPINPDEMQENITRFNKFKSFLFTLTQIVEQNPHVPGLQRYAEMTRQWQALKMNLIFEADKFVTRWDRLGKVRAQRVADFLLELTVESDLKLEKEGSGIFTPDEYAELAQKHKLDEESIELAVDLGTHLQEMLDMLEASQLEDARRQFQTNPQGLVQATQNIQRDFNTMRNRHYFPLSRFGKYGLNVVALAEVNIDGQVFKVGETVWFGTEEGRRAQKAQRRTLEKKFPKGKFKVEMVTLRDHEQAFIGTPPQLWRSLQAELNLTPAQIKDLEKLKHLFAPGQSLRKHLLSRKNTPGFSLDAMRGMAMYSWRFANHLARATYYQQLLDAKQQVMDSARDIQHIGGDPHRRSQLGEWLNKHYEYIMNPGEEFANLRAIGFMWYIGGVVKSAFVNLTQTPLVTYPYLAARYGDAKAVAGMSTTMRDLAKNFTHGTGITEAEAELMDRARRDGFIDESLATDLAAVAEGQHLQRVLPGTKTARLVRHSGYYAAWMFHKAEMFNRRIAFLTAVRLSAERGANVEEQFSAGRHAVESSQYEYARWNRPELMRGKKSIFFLFWQYMQNTLFFSLGGDRGWWRFWLVMLGLAGVQGLPGSEDIMDMIDWVGKKIKRHTGWENPRVDVREAMREYVTELGANPDLVMHGISRYTFGAGMPWFTELTGAHIPAVDISGSLSMGRIVPGVASVFGSEQEYSKRFERGTTQASGALLSIPLGFTRALSSDDPDEWKTWERTLPTALRHVSHAVRYFQRGEETRRSGEQIATFDPHDPYQLAEIAAQGLGFTPTKISTQWEGKIAEKEAGMYYQNRRAILLEQFDYALRTDDRQGIKDVRAGIKRYNNSVPYGSLKIAPDSIFKSMVERQTGRKLGEAGIPKQKKLTPLYKDIQQLYPQPSDGKGVEVGVEPAP